MELKNYFVQNANGDVLPGATAALVNGSAVSIRAQERTYNKHTELRLGRNQFSGSLWGQRQPVTRGWGPSTSSAPGTAC